MSRDLFIVIPNWDEFQHYKGKERPAWIKLYPKLLRNNEYLDLTPSDRAALVGIWMLYAESGRRVAEDTAKLSRQLSQRITKGTLARLNHAGFIEFRSRDALDEVYAREEKSREEKRTPLPPSREGGENGTPRQRGENPRAAAKRTKERIHDDMVAAAWEDAPLWTEQSTELLHERLDGYEKTYGSVFTDQERDRLLDHALANASPL